jgi:threonine dehydrogenase-like Zn-dependent dehydrogenase
MKAVEITEPGKAQLVEREKPTPGAGEVLLRVRRIGYCGTDLSTFRGTNPLVSYPRVPGHEIAATIEAHGPNVASMWRAGQNVLVMPYTSCGKCSACTAGRTNCCAANQTLGVQREGALAEWIAVPAEKLIASETLSLTELALVEPLTVGFHGAGRGRVTSGDMVGVIGCGAIGLGVIAGAAFRGGEVIAIDVDDAKLNVARACGATHVVNSQRENLHERLRELTGGHGPRVIVEAVGLPATYRTAVEEVCFAGRVVCLGYAKAAVEFETKFFVLKELDIVGSRNALPGDFADVVGMLEVGKFPSNRVVTQTVSIDEAPEAIQRWSDAPATVTKIHVTLDA